MLKQIIKPYVPVLIRKIYRGIMNYFKRMGRWLIILFQMRGVTFIDQLKLLLSALISPITSLKTLLKWQNPVLLFDTNVKVYGNGYFVVRAFTDDIWHVLPWRESRIFDYIKQNLNEGNVFVDAGANIGVYSILASSLVGRNGQVVSIEMIPETANRLKKHSKNNNCKNIKMIESALSNIAGEIVRAYIPQNKFGMASIEVKHEDKDLMLVEVQTETLNNILSEYNSIDLMKMDLEGAEFKALQGASEVLSGIKCIIFESHTQSSEIVVLLEKNGFSIRKLSGRDMLAVKKE